MICTKQQRKTKARDKRKVLVVDDHPVVREGLTYLIEEQEDLAVCGTSEDIPQAIKAIESLKPDMVTVDISLKDASGLDLIKVIKTQFPGLPVLALSVHPEQFYAERAIRAGAKGYITKREDTGEIIAAIREVLDGRIYLSRRMTERLLHSLVGNGKSDVEASPVDRLTDRELDVFSLLGQGRGTRQIAEHLHVSIKTVETYRLRITKKLNVDHASELLQSAFQWASEQEKVPASL
jgi:DNA-binding NarL/FixJ family response regulator